MYKPVLCCPSLRRRPQPFRAEGIWATCSCCVSLTRPGKGKCEIAICAEVDGCSIRVISGTFLGGLVSLMLAIIPLGVMACTRKPEDQVRTLSWVALMYFVPCFLGRQVMFPTVCCWHSAKVVAHSTLSPIPSSHVNEAPVNLPARYFHEFVTLSALIRIQSAGNSVRWSVGACPGSS